jgi:hypothetical protein
MPSPHNSEQGPQLVPPQSIPTSSPSWIQLLQGSQAPHSPPQSKQVSPKSGWKMPSVQWSHSSQGPPQSTNCSLLFKIPSKQLGGILLSGFGHPVSNIKAPMAKTNRLEKIFVLILVTFLGGEYTKKDNALVFMVALCAVNHFFYVSFFGAILRHDEQMDREK